MGLRADRQDEPSFAGMSYSTWAKIGIVSGLFAAVFWPNLRRLWLKTNPISGEPNWGHAIVVPIIGLYYLYVHREELLKASGQQFVMGSFTRPGRLWVASIMAIVGVAVALLTHGHSGMIMTMAGALGWACGVLGVLALLMDWSLATTLFGLALFAYGIHPGDNDYLKDMGMIVTLFGIVLMMFGWEVMRVAWFPIVFLICAIPWPGLVYSWVAEPLQQMAAFVAVLVLKTTGVDAMTSGTKIIISSGLFNVPPRVLNVAEACAGMRSLMTFITVGGAVAFYSNRPLWQKLIVVCSSVPIAIFCNVMRISGQGLLDHYGNPAWSESFAHQFVGMVMLLPAFFLILAVAYMLDKLFIEETDEVELPETIVRKAATSSVMVRKDPAAVVVKPAPVAIAPAVKAPIVKAPVVNAPVVKAPVVKAPEIKAPATQTVVRPEVVRPAAANGTVAASPRPALTPPRPRSLAPLQQRSIVPPRPASPGVVREPGQPAGSVKNSEQDQS